MTYEYFEEEDKIDSPINHNQRAHLNPSSPLPQQQLTSDSTRKLYRIDNWLKWYIIILSAYLAVAIFSVAWSYTGVLLDDDSSQRRIFRTSENIPVDQLYSGIVLSAFLAPAGVLVQLIVHEFRGLHLFALATQRPIKVADLDDINDNFSLWTLRTVVKYSWWYGLMHAVLIFTRTLLVPVGTLILTVGPYTPLKSGSGVVGLPISRADAIQGNFTPLSSAMGGEEKASFSPSFGDDDAFLNQLVYTFVGNLVSQSALVNVDSGILGPVPTHNITFEHNTTYDGLVFFRWNANCRAATEVSYLSYQQNGSTIFDFTMPSGYVESIKIISQGSQRTKLWHAAMDGESGRIPAGGTTFFVSATTSVTTINDTTLADKVPDESLVRVDDGHWISRTKCTPSLDWVVGSCTFNGTIMASCLPSPRSNTSQLDTAALDALSAYMTAIPWYIFNKQLAIVDNTLDQLYSIPTSRDFGHFFGNMAHAIVSISTAGYFGTSKVPTLSRVTEQVYIVRTSVLIAFMLMLALSVAVCVLDIVRNQIRRLPYLPAGFLSIAHAVRGSWWERELDGNFAWDNIKQRESHASTVMFGIDRSEPTYIRLAPSVTPIHR